MSTPNPAPDLHPDLTKAEALALERGGFRLAPTDLEAEDPLARTATDYTTLLKASLAMAELAACLGVDSNRILQHLTALPPTLYGIRLESGWVIPEFQLDAGQLLPGLAEIVPQLDPGLHPLTVLRWFTTPNPDLISNEQDSHALSPRDWLRMGHPAGLVASLAGDL